MRHKVSYIEDGRAVEITCTNPGNWDGCLMGYAIKFSGGWDGWVMPRHDHATLRLVASNTELLDTAVAAIVQHWERDTP